MEVKESIQLNYVKLLQIEFEPASLQTQIPFNVQTKVQFKIARTLSCLFDLGNVFWSKFGRFF